MKKQHHKDRWLQIRVTEQEARMAKAKASRRGLSLSAWVLRMIRRAK